MTTPTYPRQGRRWWHRRPHLERRWRIDACLAYDGGGGTWAQGYRTHAGARVAAWWHYHVASWGGQVTITDTREGR